MDVSGHGYFSYVLLSFFLLRAMFRCHLLPCRWHSIITHSRSSKLSRTQASIDNL